MTLAPPPAPPAFELHPFVLACLVGNTEAMRRHLPPGEADAHLLIRGLHESLKHGHPGVACDLLSASPAARKAVTLQAAALLRAASKSGNEAAFDALLGLGLAASDRAEALLHSWESPRHRNALLDASDGLIPLALSLALSQGKAQLPLARALLAEAPADQAPELLDALTAYARSLPSVPFPEKVPLARIMELAAAVRPAADCVRPIPSSSRDGVERALAEETQTPEEWAKRWVGWMVDAETWAVGEAWSSLHRRPMPPAARETYWVVLAARLAGDGLDAVPAEDRLSLMRALASEEARARPTQSPTDASWPSAQHTSSFASPAPLNAFLIAWRARNHPELYSVALAHNDNRLLHRLLGFGADPGFRLPGGETVLQNIARHRRFVDGNYWRSVRGIDWSIKTKHGENLVHLLFKKPPTGDEGADLGAFDEILALLALWQPYLPNAVWSEPDESGLTPWMALQAWRARLGENPAAQELWLSWSADCAALCARMEVGALQHALGAPEAEPGSGLSLRTARRRRM